MVEIQAGARIADTPEELKCYYRECLEYINEDMHNDPEGSRIATTYVKTCLSRLAKNPGVFDSLREPPIFGNVNGILTQRSRDGKFYQLG